MDAKSSELEDLVSGDRVRTAMAIVRTFESLRRSRLSEMRTGIGLITIALSILAILITTSRLYIVQDVFLLITALVSIDAILIALGTHLVIKALRAIRRIERKEKTIDFDFDNLSVLFRKFFDED